MKNKRYNNIEEWANTLSHGIGILLGIVAGYLLLEKASKNIEPQWAVACVSVYLAGMLSSYVSSTWYHGSRPGKLKELLRKFDHGAIYLHIAGTYTPLPCSFCGMPADGDGESSPSYGSPHLQVLF